MVEMVNTKVNGQYDIILPKHRADRPEWFSELGWEKKRLDRLLKSIKKDDVVYYVGTEEGDMAGLCQMQGAKMVLFEPNDRVWANIKAIWEANKLEQPLISFVGFASNRTSLKDYVFTEGGMPECANGEVIGDHGFKELAYEADVVPEIKIDDLVTQTKHIPNIISLDVEGSEFEVLRGAEQTLKTYHPDIFLSLHPEFMFNMFGEYGGDLRNWIKDIGYTEELLDYQHEVHLVYKAIQ